ncbi:helix-turn-helix domain-containing protein [Streptomyces sp. SID13031]|uniref:winged helix-turn-helix transcriptional regulator n=1 Tax=Streptomyces sp. SID13031 TaxID=2706046 RepID=UPI0013C7FD0B|nr:helix-turn-helix domain-containing protein [Streptomyces sp. SID13031]NEA35669.1 helix-turn-helix transcriptional regulator [Streptomyces sp. SID13031]
MTTKTYGQYCGVARALELVGERWALLIVRDLLVGPKRYTDLRAGLPKIPTNVLATRLKELEAAGLVVRTVQPRPSGAIVYELTGYGADLEDVVLALGRWGARSLGDLRPDEIITPDILVMALRSTFHRGARKAKYELHFGDIVIHALIDADNLTVGLGPLEGAVILEAYAPIAPLLTGAINGAAALKSGLMKTSGTAKDLDHFAAAFPIGPPA